MPTLHPKTLRQVGYDLFEAAGCLPEDAQAVTDHLVESSLFGTRLARRHSVCRVCQRPQKWPLSATRHACNRPRKSLYPPSWMPKARSVKLAEISP